jgi:hypothetical protein
MMTSQQMTDIEVAPDIEVALKQLPTATTLNERKLAFHYAANIWDGQTDVFENGPLLGGITRALAIGMYVNERRRPDTRLRTYDWFSLRVGVDLPEGTWRRLVEFGYLTNEQVNAAHAAGTFKPLFEALHSGCDYWPLVQPEVGYLPGHRNDVPKFGESVFYAPAGRKFGLVLSMAANPGTAPSTGFSRLLLILHPMLMSYFRTMVRTRASGSPCWSV